MLGLGTGRAMNPVLAKHKTFIKCWMNQILLSHMYTHILSKKTFHFVLGYSRSANSVVIVSA